MLLNTQHIIYGFQIQENILSWELINPVLHSYVNLLIQRNVIWISWNDFTAENIC